MAYGTGLLILRGIPHCEFDSHSGDLNRRFSKWAVNGSIPKNSW